MLEQLVLENFKGHDELHATFAPGLNLITGRNYSGKSTILHGILFAFFGVSAVPGGSKIVPSRNGKASATRVMAQFYHNGKTYKIERKVSSARLHRDGKLIASSLSGVNKELESVFNVPQRMFMRLKYAEQGETQALLTLGIGELHKIIEHVSGVHLVNRVIDRSSRLSTAASNKLEVLGPLPDLQAAKAADHEMRESLTSLYASVQAKQDEANQLADRLDLANRELHEATQWNTTQARVESQRQTIASQLRQAEESRQAANAALAEHRPLASKSEELEKEAASLQQVANSRDTLVGTLAMQQSEYSTLSGRLVRERGQADGLRAELAEMPDPDVSTLSAAAAKARQEITSILENIDGMRIAISKAVCPACNRPFEGADTGVLERQLAGLEERLGEAQKAGLVAIEAHKQAVSQAERRKEKENSLFYADYAVKNTESSMKDIMEAIRETEARMAALPHQPPQEKIVAAVERARAAQRALGAYREADRAVGAAQTAINDLNARLSKLPQVEDRVDTGALESKVNALSRSWHLANQEVNKLSAEYGGLYRKWELAAQQLANDMDRAATIQSLHAEKSAAGSLSKYLRDNRDRFMAALWEQVTGYASDFASMCTGGALTGMERTKEGSFQYLEDGTSAVIHGASGAQKSIMSLGIQLAMDTLLPDTFGALLLDEPTSQMDGEHSLAVTQALSQSGRQIVMVSHREMDASVAAAHIHLA